MRIVIIQGAFLPVPPILGGAVEKIWYGLGQEFAALGHEVTHIGRSYPGLPDQEESYCIKYLRVLGYNTPSSIIKLKWLDLLYSLRAIKKVPIDADVIITNTFWSPILLRGKIAKKVYVSVDRLPKGQMWLYKQASRLRANSDFVAKAIRRELSVNQHQRVVVIPNPIPFDYIPTFDLSEKKPILLYVGRVHPEKGIELLVRAFKKLENNWKLQIVGPSEIEVGGGGLSYLESLKNLASDNVEFIGPVYDMVKLNQLYAQASIFVYPSIAERGESFGLSPLEAMAWGCAPVVSNLSCFRDFISHERNGLTFDHRSDYAVELLKKAIQRLQEDNLLRIKLAKQAHEVCKTHSIGSIASQFIKEFECVIREQPNKPNKV